MTLAKEACYKGLAFEEIMNSAYSPFIFAVINCECLPQGTSVLFMITDILNKNKSCYFKTKIFLPMVRHWTEMHEKQNNLLHCTLQMMVVCCSNKVVVVFL